MGYKKMDIAVVTEASSGLGKQIAKLLCERGKIVWSCTNNCYEIGEMKIIR